jgi:hypothetical protein
MSIYTVCLVRTYKIYDAFDTMHKSQLPYLKFYIPYGEITVTAIPNAAYMSRNSQQQGQFPAPTAGERNALYVRSF